MKALLVALAALLVGCGGPSLGTPAPEAEGGVRGPLALQVLLVDYADTPCPYTLEEGWQVVGALNALVVRLSTGAAWVVGDVQRLPLPLPAAAYAGDYGHEGRDASLSGPLQVACRSAAPPCRLTVFLVPAYPAIFWGAGRPGGTEGYAWLSAVTAPLALPLPHEAGHALGLPHTATGIMSGTDSASQCDWGGALTPEARASLGWI